MNTKTTTKAPIHPGRHVAFRIPNTEIVVTVHNQSRPGATVWRVETTVVGILNDSYTRPYDDENTARAEARRLCREFAAGLRPATLDNPTAVRTWNQVAYELDQETRRRNPNRARAAALEAELAGLTYPTAA